MSALMSSGSPQERASLCSCDTTPSIIRTSKVSRGNAYRVLAAFIALLALGLADLKAQAPQNYYFTNWTSASQTLGSGVAAGTLNVAGNPVSVSVGGCTTGTVTDGTYPDYIATGPTIFPSAVNGNLGDTLGSDQRGAGFVITFSQPVADPVIYFIGRQSPLSVKGDGADVYLDVLSGPIGAWDSTAGSYTEGSGLIVGYHLWTDTNSTPLKPDAMIGGIVVPGVYTTLEISNAPEEDFWFLQIGNLTTAPLPCPTVNVTPNPLSSGTVGIAYTGSPAASGGTAPYVWTATGLPSGLSINGTTGAVTGTPTATGNATITATDGNGCTGTTTLVINPFSCPIITVEPNPLNAGTVGSPYNDRPKAGGAGDGVTYTWSATGLPAGLALNSSTGEITGTPTVAGNATITATYTGPGGELCTGSTTLTVNGPGCPTITVTPNPLSGGTVGTAYNASPSASGGTAPYIWTATGLPSGLSINPSTGAISGNPTAAGTATITATDANGCTGTTTLTVNPLAAPCEITVLLPAVSPCSTCPSLTVSPAVLPNGTAGTAYSQNLSASGGVSPYTFAVTSGTLPAGLSLSNAGLISGTPTSTSAANFTITVTDASGCTVANSFTITPACPVVTVTPNPLSSGTVGTAYTGSPSASGGITPYSWTASSLPAGLSINPSTGAITGTPTASGNATITAADANGCTGTTSLTINPFSCPIITVTPNPLANGTVGTAYSASPTASGAPGGSSYAWTATGLPAGLSLNATTGVISGTPTATGNATITATFSGPGGEQCQGSTTLGIGCPSLTVSPASLPNGAAGTPYSQTLSASGGTSPYTFAVTTGALPAGLAINTASGLISGTPTSTSAASFTITTTDASGCIGTRSFTVTPVCPTINITPNPLSSGTVGTAYTGSPSASGGTAPYTWTASSLPAGLSINASSGAITGTPTAAGSATITATDSNNCTGTTTLTVSGTPLLACGMAVGTCSADPDYSAGGLANNNFSASSYVVGIMDIRQPPAPSPNTNWVPPMIHHPEWIYGTLNGTTGMTDKLGGVFGIAIDSSKHIYLTSFKPYSPNGTGVTAAAPGFGGPGAIYKLDASSGAVSVFATLPQSSLPAAPMLGNIAYDADNNQFFVSNFEDGKIYRLSSSGAVGSSFDPGSPDDSNAGIVAVGERVWGLGYYQGRVYYAMWKTGLTNEIRSVAVDSGGIFSGDQTEFSLPMSSNTSARHSPIADIEFASNGAMLLVERTMNGTSFQSEAHYSKSYEYVYNLGSWNQSHVYFVGDYAGLNTGLRTHAAGGGDYGYTSVDPLTDLATGEDERVWISGDTLKYASGNYIFGFQGIPRDPSNSQTNPTASANLIDANGDTSIVDKYSIGDIDVCKPCLTALSCSITGIVVTAGSCNDNGTPAVDSDDYYTASVTVTFSNAPATGTLDLSGSALHPANTMSSVAVGSLGSGTSHTFAGVKLKANNVANSLSATFSAEPACTYSVAPTAIPPCSVCPTLTLTPISLPNGTVGATYNETLAASGAGTPPYTFTVTTGALPAGLAINETSGLISGTPTSTSAASFTITATDTNDCTGTRSFTVTPACPVITVTPNPLSSGTVGTAYTGSPAVSGGTAPYSWTATSLPSGLSINPTTGAITGNPTATGTATITATDANGCTGTTSLTINPFACPIITVTPNPLANGTVGTAYSASPTASGAPGGSSYAWTATGLPAGLILNATTGVISGTPIATGNATITATFSGPGGEQCQGSTTLAVTAAPCPTITVTPAVLPNGTVGTAYNQSLVPTGGTTPYTFAVTLGSLPAGLSLNGGTGAITGIPTSTSAASFTITATDANDCTGTRSFTVTPACPVITVTPNPLSSGTVGTAYTGSPSAGGGTAPYTWTATSLPAGLSISPSTGAITGNPTATGTATITATDTNGCTGTTSLTINPFACPTITVTPAILPEASVGQPYSETPTASGAGGGASYGWSATSLPAGLSINPTTGLISGTPTAEGTATITATYTGPGGELCTGTATLSIVNNCCPQLIFAVP